MRASDREATAVPQLSMVQSGPVSTNSDLVGHAAQRHLQAFVI